MQCFYIHLGVMSVSRAFASIWDGVEFGYSMEVSRQLLRPNHRGQCCQTCSKLLQAVKLDRSTNRDTSLVSC